MVLKLVTLLEHHDLFVLELVSVLRSCSNNSHLPRLPERKLWKLRVQATFGAAENTSHIAFACTAFAYAPMLFAYAPRTASPILRSFIIKNAECQVHSEAPIWTHRQTGIIAIFLSRVWRPRDHYQTESLNCAPTLNHTYRPVLRSNFFLGVYVFLCFTRLASGQGGPPRTWSTGSSDRRRQIKKQNPA